MADETKPNEGTEQATDAGAGKGTQEAPKDERFKDLEAVDPGVLKRYVDQQVTRAIKTNEEKLQQAGLIDMDDLVHVVDAAVAAAVADDGSVDDAKVKAVLDEFKKSKPHKFKDGQPDAPRFRGAATPAQQQATVSSPAFGPDSTEAWIKEREAKLKELKRPVRPRSTIDMIAEAVLKRSKGA